MIDPNELDAQGGTSVDWFAPSLDGKKLVVVLGKGGSEDGVLHVYDAQTATVLPDTIADVAHATAGFAATWNADGTGFYYTRYPHKGERPDADLNFFQQVYFHRLGTLPQNDTYAIGKDFPRIAEITLDNSRDGKVVLATVENGDGGDYERYLLGPSGGWKQLTHFADQIKQGRLGQDGAIYFISLADAPHGKILRMPLEKPNLDSAKVIVPTGDAIIQQIAPAKNALYVSDLVGGPSQLRRFALDGTGQQRVPIPTVSAISEMLVDDGNALLFNDVSYTQAGAWYRCDGSKSDPVKTAIFQKWPVSFDDIEVTRELATSKDGTRIPVNILHKKGIKLDGQNPALLYAYGGYNISIAPSFDFSLRLWFDRGGLYAVANLRGGGEFGEEWHKGGSLTHKQNVFDDFTAAAEYLIKQGYTSPEKLAFRGESNGGLLMGAMITQHPQLARAVVSLVGLYDMLRVELAPNGAFNTTEFGTVKDAEQFKALYAYSPYHHVVDGTKYPAILLMTGANDGRVSPYHSRKMIARLLEANRSANPILLRTTSAAGHGMGTALDEYIRQHADAYCLFFDQLGMPETPR